MKIKLEKLEQFCRDALVGEGMSAGDAETCAAVLTETDGYGMHSHGTKNLYNYIKKKHAGGVDFAARPEIVREGGGYALIDANNAMGMVGACMGMELACRKAAQTGIAMALVKNSCHFGAAGYYANLAAKQGLIGICVSNVDPNMTIPGARGMTIGNNPLAYAAPAGRTQPTLFLDIALSNVASLKVIQARKDGVRIPSTWIVDKDGLPTTDPSHYPEEGAMQPMAAHKGYGISVLVELLTGALSGGGMSMMGDIVSWCFCMERPNNVSHTLIAVDPASFGSTDLAERVDSMIQKLHEAPRAKGSDRIYVPGEIEWERYAKAAAEGVELPADVYGQLKQLADESGLELPVF